MKYCKWHNATSHDINDCKIFKQQIRSAIEQGRLKFETPISIPSQLIWLRCLAKTSRVKLLTSDSAHNKGVVDPKVQITVADAKGKGLLLEEDLKARRLVMT
jgi:hypothetical protein